MFFGVLQKLIILLTMDIKPKIRATDTRHPSLVQAHKLEQHGNKCMDKHKWNIDFFFNICKRILQACLFLYFSLVLFCEQKS